MAMVALSFCAIHSNAQENQGFMVDKIIAKVDNYIVLKSELDKAYLEYVANGGQGGDQSRCQFLALHLESDGDLLAHPAADPAAWFKTSEAKTFITGSGNGWGEADLASGTSSDEARAAAAKTIQAYTGS